MMIFGSSFTAHLLEILLALLLILIVHYKRTYKYWANRNVPTLPPAFIFGHGPKPYGKKEQIGVHLKHVYDEARAQGWQHCGIYFFTSVNYMPLNLEYLKSIMTKDFQYFTERGTYYNEADDPLSAHLFALGGNKWRNLRVKLSETFTSGKMRMMFPTLVSCEKLLRKTLAIKHDLHEAVDIKEVLNRFTLDIIGSCAFGLDFNTFQDDDSPFIRYGKKIFQRGLTRRLLIGIGVVYPELGRFLGIRINEPDLTDFFMKMVDDAIKNREQNNIVRKDFLQLLIELKNNPPSQLPGQEHDGKCLTLKEVAAQCFVFFLAGYESSAGTMSFALYEMAKNPDIQTKVRQEINSVLKKHNGEITYEALNEMKYLGLVLDETLRKYPATSLITRKCVKDYKIPGTDTVLKKKMLVAIPILAIHYDAEYYPDPDKFDPERFNEENRSSIPQYAYLPFGEGPRICIGMRFAMMQSKVGLTSLIKHYKFTLSEKTQEPLEFSPDSFVLAATGGIWLNLEKI